MNRRVALQGLAGLAAAAGGRPAFEHLSGAASMATEASVTVLLDEPIGTIRPAVYGQFTEHIGGVIYDGIWVGTGLEGRRTSAASARPWSSTSGGWARSSIRWPGGCFADRYHWRDGIGPAASRPRRFGRWQRGDRAEHVRHARVHPVLPALRGRAVLRRQRGDRLARGIPAMGRVLQRPRRGDHAGRRARGQRRSRAVGRPLLGRGQRELGLRREVHARGLLPRVSQVHRVAPRVRREAVSDRRRAEQQRPRLDAAGSSPSGPTMPRPRSRAGRPTTTAARPATPSSSRPTSGTSSSTRPTRWRR